MNLSLHAIVIGIESNTERFNRVHLFEPENGYLCALKPRPSKKIGSNNFDLFQEIELIVQKKNETDIGFIKEFSILSSHSGIGKSYAAFESASRFCRAIQLNARHMPHPESVFELLRTSLEAWDAKPNPEVTFFKALYRLAYEEGFPVKEGWLLRLNKSDQEVAKSVLYRRVEEQQPETEGVKQLAETLIHWLTHHQDFLF